MFKSFENHNPFPFVALILFAALLLRHYAFVTPGSKFSFLATRLPITVAQIVWGLLTASLVLTLIFEIYFYYFNCRVSSSYYSSNMQNFAQVYTVLQIYQVSVWLDYATLLQHTRHQYGNNVWDHDYDISILKPGTYKSLPKDHQKHFVGEENLLNVEHLQKILLGHGLVSYYHPKRELLQVFSQGQSGPHVDIWLWSPLTFGSGDHSAIYLQTFETSAYNPRSFDDIFPLVNMTWPGAFDPYDYEIAGSIQLNRQGVQGGTFGKSVLIPGKSQKICAKEFGQYGGDVMTPMVFKSDCLHNFVNLRFLW